MILGLEEYYDRLIAEAKSPEEIKRTMEYKFVQGKGVPQEVLNYLLEIDPTKKKNFTNWVLIHWESERNVILSAIKDKTMKRVFKLFKERAGQGLDLNAMKSVAQAIEMLPDVDPVLDKEDGSEEENDFDVVYDTPEWTIAVPHSYPAAKKLGKGCKWCTAGAFGDGQYYYNRYSSKGPLWVNFDRRGSEVCPMDNKEYPYKRYQFLFEWENWAGEFMDKYDHRVNISEMDFPEGVVDFYRSQDERYGEVIENGPENDAERRRIEYEEERTEVAIGVLEYNGRYLDLMPEENDDCDIDGVNWYLYDNEDYSDSVFPNTPYNPEDFLIKSYPNTDEPIAILKDYHGYPVLVYGEESDGRWGGTYFDWEEEDDLSIRYSREVDIIAAGGGKVFAVPTNGGYGPYKIKELEDADSDFSIESVEPSEAIEAFIRQYKGTNPGLNTYPGSFVELIYVNGNRGLLYMDSEGYEFFIHNDRPENTHFMPFMKGGKLCAKGQYFEYELESESEANYHIAEKINDHFFIVEGKSGKNIYSVEEKKFVFEHPFKDIEWYSTTACDLAICEDSTGFRFFDIDNRKWVGDTVDDYSRPMTSRGFYWACRTEGKDFYIFSFDRQDGPRIFGPFKKMAYQNIHDGYVVVTDKNGHVNVFDIEAGRFAIEGEFGVYGTVPQLEKLGLVYLGKDKDNVSLYDYFNGTCVLNGVSGRKTPVFYGIVADTNITIWVIWDQDLTGGYIMGNKNIVLKKKLNIIQGGRISANAYIPVIDNNRFFYIETNGIDTSLLPNQNGISLDGINLSQSYDGAIQFTTTRNGMQIRFNYQPWAKNPIYIEYPNNPEIGQIVQSIIYPEQVQVRENFNKIYKSIIDVDRRRNGDEEFV